MVVRHRTDQIFGTPQCKRCHAYSYGCDVEKCPTRLDGAEERTQKKVDAMLTAIMPVTRVVLVNRRKQLIDILSSHELKHPEDGTCFTFSKADLELIVGDMRTADKPRPEELTECPHCQRSREDFEKRSTCGTGGCPWGGDF